MSKLLFCRRRFASAPRQFLSAIIAAFMLLQPVLFGVPPAAAQKRGTVNTTAIDDIPGPNDTGTGSVSLTTLGSPAPTETFDTLSNTAGSTTNTTLPTGWYITEQGGGARDNEQYAVDTGGSNTGDTYSYGAAASTDRALGGLRSGTLIPFFGAQFTNNTGGTITSLDIAYTGEQWRLGTAGRTDRIDFQLSTNATDLTTGTYTDVDALDFTAPNTVAPLGPKDGNAAGNRTTISSSITSLTIANGASFFIRWIDLDATNADDGLTVENFIITPQGVGGGGVSLSINDVSMNEGNGGTTAFNFTVSLSSSVHGGVTFDICSQDGTAQDGSNVGEDTDYSPICFGAQSIANGSDSAQYTVNVNGDTTSEANETFFVNVTNVVGATVADGQGQGTIVNDDVTVTAIHNIQGNGTSTPMPGAEVTTTGIVTLLKTGSNGGAGAANGFFLQTPDADADADPNTSQGILVFTSGVPTYTSSATPVAVGDEVSVTGTVTEFFNMTELSPVTNITLIDSGNPLPTAVTLDTTILASTALPTQPQLEKFEGMRMSGASLTTAVPNDNFFDIDTVLSSVPRPLREPGIGVSFPVPPDPTSGVPDANVPRWDENPERLKLDTNGRAGAPNIAYTSNVTFTGITGPLDFAFSEYRLIPEIAPTATGNMSAVPVPSPSSNEFTIAGYNIENFNNNATQRQKASLTIRNVLHYPDIIGTIEIFDLADLQALRDQVNNDAVSAGDPNPLYEAFLVEQDGTSNDSDQDVGYLVKTARVAVNSVTQEREEVTFIEPGTGNTAILHDRPPLVLNATVDPSGTDPQTVIVIVNHLRSFIDIEQDPGDGPRVREKRKLQGEDLADLLNDLQTANPTTPVVSIGDYNAFQFNDGYTDPIATIKGTPTADDQVVVDQSPDVVDPNLFNLIDELPAAEQYSFIFEGTPQVLDHVIVNTAGRARNTRIAIARNNADFPENPASAFASNAARPERNSDHDIPVAYFALGEPQQTGTFIISEFRHRGPGASLENAPANGPCSETTDTRKQSNAPGTSADNDEFIELYNNTDAPITVATLDGSAGWAVVASDGVTRFVVPNGTVIPVRGHYLGVNSDGYSLCGCASGDSTYTLDIPDNVGLALFNTANPTFFTLANRLDAAGSTSETNELYREGTGYPALTGTLTTDHAFFRDLRTGTHKDTGDNAADFLFVDVNGTSAGAGQRLGAPGPENLSSPIQRNADMPLALLDGTQPAAQPPNRVRDLTSDPMNNSTFGTLLIRRRIVNNTGEDISQLRIRIVQFTTFPAPPGTADLRARTSAPVLVSGINDADTCAAAGAGPPPCAVNVTGTVLEQPPGQPNGGGWNSTMNVPLPFLTMSPGESVNVQFLLGVQQTGAFKFFINIEMLEEPPITGAPSGKTKRAL